MWQFDKALRLDLYGQDDVSCVYKYCKQHKKYGLYGNYINEENTSACDFFTRLLS